MALNFTTITDSNTIKELTEQVNNIGSELTKERNIFRLVDELTGNIANTQKYKLTDDTGLAKVPSLDSVLREIKDAGLYYINARTLASMYDKPNMSSVDVVMQVTPIDSKSRVIQQMYPLSLNNEDMRIYFRYVNNTSSSDWQVVHSLANGTVTSLAGKNILEETKTGKYFVAGYNTGLPDEVREGFVDLFVDGNDNRMLNLVDTNTNKHYTNIKKQDNDYSGWKKELEPKDMQKYFITNIDGEVDSFPLAIYTADNISFKDAVVNHIANKKQPTFTFYVQGGVQEAPSENSCRGIFISDTLDTSSIHGVYLAIDLNGVTYSGAISNSNWKKPLTNTSSKLLWQGAKSINDIGAVEGLTDDIANYNYVKIFLSLPTKDATVKDKPGRIEDIGHEFYVKGKTQVVPTGAIVGHTVNTVDYYRVGVLFGKASFRITHQNYSNTGFKDAYITRIIGINY